MTSSKGPTYFQNLCYKCYKTYAQSYFVPSLLQIKQILNKLERVFQWLPQPYLFDLKNANFCRVPKLTSLKLCWINITIISLKIIQYNILLKHVISISNWCSIPNNDKNTWNVATLCYNRRYLLTFTNKSQWVDTVNFMERNLYPVISSQLFTSVRENTRARIVNTLLKVKSYSL